MRVVLDTDVVLSGLNSPAGASRLLLIASWEGAIVPLASVAMMLEYEAVLKRPEHLLRMRLQSDGRAGDSVFFVSALNPRPRR